MNTQAPNKVSSPLIPLQFFASSYGHAALLDSDGNELPITENMILMACEEAMDLLYSFLPTKGSYKIEE